MPTNPYFNAYNDTLQQELYRSLIDECLKMFGLDSLYIARSSQSQLDLLFGDDPSKKFDGGYPIAVYILSTDSFEGPGDLFSKFGLVISKQMRLLMSNDAFQDATNGDLGSRPREGDLVWLAPFQALFEITFVGQDKFFYAFGRKVFYGYELTVEEFRYNNEVINSGDPEVDDKVNSVKTVYLAQMGNASFDFIQNEQVFQGANLSSATSIATVVSWDITTHQLVLKDLYGLFLPNNSVTGSQSGAVAVLNSIDTQDNVNEEIDNNVLLRTEANTYLDLTESNPLQGNPITSNTQQF